MEDFTDEQIAGLARRLLTMSENELRGVYWMLYVPYTLDNGGPVVSFDRWLASLREHAKLGVH